MRERLEGDGAFTAITVEAERIRLFNDHISSLEVGRWSIYSKFEEICDIFIIPKVFSFFHNLKACQNKRNCAMAFFIFTCLLKGSLAVFILETDYPSQTCRVIHWIIRPRQIIRRNLDI